MKFYICKCGHVEEISDQVNRHFRMCKKCGRIGLWELEEQKDDNQCLLIVTESQQHELFGILNAVGKEQDENFMGVDLDNYPEKYHDLIMLWVNGKITPNQAVAKAIACHNGGK